MLLALTLLIAGCGSSKTQVTLKRVVIAPAAATLAPGQSQQFTITGNGASVSSFVWAINGMPGGNADVGTISSEGLYSAPSGSAAPTSVTVSATDPSAPETRVQATITFRHDSLTISPSGVTVSAGRSVQFSASSSNQNDTTFVWKVNEVTGGNSIFGTISSQGLYSAPSCSPSASSVTIQVASSSDPQATAQAQVNVASAFALSPAQASVPVGQTLQFELTSTGPNIPVVQWSVNGLVGGNSQVGTVVGAGTFIAPASIPAQPVSISVADVAQGCSIAQAQVQIYDPAVNEAHDKWLDGVADAAASYGCTDVNIQQQPDETVATSLARFLNTANEGSCLVLSPINSQTGLPRYSLAWGGSAFGKDIFYISDMDQVRIWNGQAAN